MIYTDGSYITADTLKELTAFAKRRKLLIYLSTEEGIIYAPRFMFSALCTDIGLGKAELTATVDLKKKSNKLKTNIKNEKTS